jgi:hypothetical protein
MRFEHGDPGHAGGNRSSNRVPVAVPRARRRSLQTPAATILERRAGGWNDMLQIRAGVRRLPSRDRQEHRFADEARRCEARPARASRIMPDHPPTRTARLAL